MTTLTLLVKASSSKHLQLVDEQLKAEFENLDLQFDIASDPSNKWVQVSLSGEDEVIATNYIKNEIGLCPVTAENINESSVLKGYITSLDVDNKELRLDVGIFKPKTIQASIPEANLQRQLVNGKNLSLRQISVLFGLSEKLPLSIKVTEDEKNGTFPAELSQEQVEKLNSWQQSLLDRLIVLRSSGDEVKEVLERSKLNRDVIGIERLGLFEHALTCKLGTDAAGLIPRIGRYMKYAKFIVFDAKKTLALFH